MEATISQPPSRKARPARESSGHFMQYIVDSNGCWVWQGWKTNRGYGMMKVGGITYMAHRVFYEERLGPIPAELEIDHKCRVHSCVNPEHLEPVTHAENMRRWATARVELGLVATACTYGHPLDGVRTRSNGGGRYCKTCVRDSKRRQRAKEGLLGVAGKHYGASQED